MEDTTMAKTERASLPGNVSPNRMTQTTSGDRRDTYYGNKGESQHGHTVEKGGKTEYSRTMRGTVTKDSKK
jgi:hypothetical protein